MGHTPSFDPESPRERPDLAGWTIHFQDEYHRFHPHNLFEHVYPGGRRLGTYGVIDTSPLRYCCIPVSPAPTVLQYAVHAGGRELHNDHGQVVACSMEPTASAHGARA